MGTIRYFGGIEMLEHIKREMRYIRGKQYSSKTTITIDGKEYTENELCVGGESTIYPESIDEQLQELIPDIDIEFITEFVNDVENVKTSDDFEDTQKTWDALVRVQGLIDKISNNDDINKFDKLYRILVKAHDTIFSNGGDICEEYTAKDNCEKCPFNNDRECGLSSTLAALKSLQDACAEKGMKK